MDKQQQAEEKRDRIREVAFNTGARLRTDYSGRGMFGATCYGIVTDYPEDVIAEVGLRGACTDSMGLSAIVYWPGVPGESTDGEDE